MKRRAIIFLCLMMALSLAHGASAQISGGPLIVLLGPPLSGKTTQMSLLENKYGLPTIATEDLIKDHAEDLKKVMMPGQNLFDMRYDPSISRYLRTKLDSIDRSKGVALDSYPATNLQAQDLAKIIADYGLKPVVLIQFEIPDEVVRERAAKTGRTIDSPTELEKRLKEYHRQFDNVATYFPNAKIHKVNGTRSVDAISKEVDGLLQADGIHPK